MKPKTQESELTTTEDETDPVEEQPTEPEPMPQPQPEPQPESQPEPLEEQPPEQEPQAEQIPAWARKLHREIKAINHRLDKMEHPAEKPIEKQKLSSKKANRAIVRSRRLLGRLSRSSQNNP